MQESFGATPRRAAATTPTDAAQMKADLEMCPPWILSKLKTERDLRRKLAEQTKEQTRILLEEVKDWRAKAYLYQREAQEKEKLRKQKQDELDRIKEMAVRAITQLQKQLAEKDEQLRKKNEILTLLKQRFLQFQESKTLQSQSPATDARAGPSGSARVSGTAIIPRPSYDTADKSSSPGRGWEAAAKTSFVTRSSNSSHNLPTGSLASSGSSTAVNMSSQRNQASMTSVGSSVSSRPLSPESKSRSPQARNLIAGSVIERPLNRSLDKEDIWSEAEVDSTDEPVQMFSPELQKQITELMGRSDSTDEKKEASLTPEQIRVLLAQPECRTLVVTELCLNENLQAILALSECVDNSILGDLTKCIVNFFLNHGQMMRLLEGIIKYEVGRTLEIGTLFRSNSVAAKVMGHFIRLCGRKYLVSLLGPLLKELAAEDKDLEIDSFRCELAEDVVQSRVAELGAICTRFLQHIDAMLDQIPLQFRIICNLLHSETKRKFPDQDWPIATGGFYFLRYICPAIVAPETYIPDFATWAKGPNVRRTLVLLTKTMQNLANGTRFFKEPFMMSMVPWIDEHLPQCKAMFLDLSTVIPSHMVETPVCPDQDLSEALKCLDDYMVQHKEAFIRSLSEHYNDSQTLNLSVKTSDQLSAIVHEVGKPTSSILTADNEGILNQLTHMLVDDKQFLFPLQLAAIAHRTAEDASKEKHDWSQRVAEALVTATEAHGSGVDFLKAQIKKEKLFMQSPESINSAMSTKMFHAYVRLTCRAYLAAVIGTVVGPIVHKNVSYDIDEPKSFPEMQQFLIPLLKELNETIVNSLQICPKSLLTLLVFIQDQAQRNHKTALVCRYILTGLFIPAIKQPHVYGILREPPKKEAQKTLDAVARVMSTIADATTGELIKPLGKHDAGLQSLVEFMTASVRSFETFFAETQLSALPHSERYPAASVPWTLALQGPKDKSLSTLYAFIHEHVAAITTAVGPNNSSISIDYRLASIFEVLLDPAAFTTQDKKAKEKKEKKEKEKKEHRKAAMNSGADKKKFSRLFG